MTLNKNFVKENNRGYTLIEILLVLSVWIFLVSVVPALFFPLKNKLETEQFFRQLQEDLFVAQQIAITEGKRINFVYRFDGHLYDIREGYSRVIIRRRLPDYVNIRHHNDLFNFFYNPSGTVSQFGILHITVHGKAYEVRIAIGRGRLHIEPKS